MTRRPTLGPATVPRWSSLLWAVPATQVGEYLEVEHPPGVDPVVVVLAPQEQFPPLPGGRVPGAVRRLPREPADRHEALQLESELRSDGDELRRLAGEVGEPVQGVAPDELVDPRRRRAGRRPPVRGWRRTSGASVPPNRAEGSRTPATRRRPPRPRRTGRDCPPPGTWTGPPRRGRGWSRPSPGSS